MNREVELSGISYTSILLYLNEILPKDAKESEKSHRFKPGKAIVNFLNEKMRN